MNELQIFKHEEFGQVRVVTKSNWLKGGQTNE